jgi:hypothetical protein
MLIAAAPALRLANTMAIGLGKKRLAKNENPEHGQHPKQHARPDGTDDPDLRSLSKSLKIQVRGWARPMGQLAEPQRDDCNGQDAPDAGRWLERGYGRASAR